MTDIRCLGYLAAHFQDTGRTNQVNMHRRQFLSDVVKHGFAVATGAATCTTSGCGSFMYSERCGQLHSSQIDWKVVALDSLGLILFFVPGLVTFIVDFYTGAIYLPAAECYSGYAAGEPPHTATIASTAATPGRPTSPAFGLKRVQMTSGPLRQQQIEQLVSQHIGQTVSLSDARTRVSVMGRIAQYNEQTSRHRADATFGFDARGILDQLFCG